MFVLSERRTNMKKIIIDEKTEGLFRSMLWLSSQKVVIKKANYINIKTGETGNTCADWQNFMYEQLGLCFPNNNLLNDKNKKDLEESISGRDKQ